MFTGKSEIYPHFSDEMVRKNCCLCLGLVVILTILNVQAFAVTDPLDVRALHDLYGSLNYPSQLKGWRSDGGDPCVEPWTGVACSGSSVQYLKLDGLNLSGVLGAELYNLRSLRLLDVSSNGIWGEIPQNLPPNVTLLNLACNHLVESIPHSLGSLKNLRHLNLSHNTLSGPIGNVFTGLQNLKTMDLSYNNFTGDLPSSFESLINLAGLFLQNNQFTGAVTLLADLPLTDLNIQDNQFSGVIPKSFQNIQNLWFGSNHFHAAGSPMWDFPPSLPIKRNISSPPTSQSTAIGNYPSPKARRPRKKKMGPGGIACIVGGVTLAVSCAAFLIAIRIHRTRAMKPKGFGSSSSSSSGSSIESQSEGTGRGEGSPGVLPIISPDVSASATFYTRKSFSREGKFPPCAKLFTLEQLQYATNGFSEERIIGEGSLGSVYKAYFPDGRILAVKVMKMASLSFKEEEQVLDVIFMAYKLRHPNIVQLVGYSIEHGQHILVYEYIRSLSLEDALHSGIYRPLPWSLRFQIALGVAQALEYMHSKVSPPIAHNNIKAGNILLDGELRPLVCDSGLAVLRPLTSNSAKLKASEMAIGDSGYIAPEDGQPGIEKTKSDVYAFGVLLLELLTGTRPFDISTPREENSLVKWASSRLHDLEYLEQMVDLGIKGTINLRVLSRIADIISRCLQPDYGFRPPMSDVVESLVCLQQKLNKAEDGNERELQDKSFRSTYTRFFGSPTSHFSTEL
ncbi:protein STRUBBELIG-RECEPTOR FAMILY 2 [Punica granatum]|uniref:Protein STRUBBELIG-RECEPTOR FAMILY 2 n=1 Tax=Punica granatum TaxID=22663 RepID=A0A6P8DY89_PUNGR|nr:protein STRUBBELIG-RECEPTOR FAMILY 2 [Punica granatum]